MASYKKIILILIYTIPLQATNNNQHLAYKAVIKSIVAEMNNNFPAPYAPSASPETQKCLRSHQGLYNEIVTVLETHNEQSLIVYDNIIYQVDLPKNGKVPNSFWVNNEHLILLQSLPQETLQAIPTQRYAQSPTIVLTYPWKQFSLGTRFVHVPSQDTPQEYAILWIDYSTNIIFNDYIPKKNALEEIEKDTATSRRFFVNLINHVLDCVNKEGSDRVIPYVWGGSSFIHTYHSTNFYLQDGVWHRPEYNSPYTGYDCSELIMRMAKIVGINFPWKTSSIIALSKRELARSDSLENGDIIWVPGHVMIVSNIDRNEIIEARGYRDGYGYVQRITIAENFVDIADYAALLKRYYNHQNIQLKDRYGNPVGNEKEFKLLKLID